MFILPRLEGQVHGAVQPSAKRRSISATLFEWDHVPMPAAPEVSGADTEAGTTRSPPTGETVAPLRRMFFNLLDTLNSRGKDNFEAAKTGPEIGPSGRRFEDSPLPRAAAVCATQ
jgi:hypothetical protein